MPTSASTNTEKVFARLESLLAEEFGLSRFKRAVAKQYIKKAFTDDTQQFECLREWLRKRLSNSKVQPLSSWQRGCPQLFPKLRAKAFWNTSDFPWIKDIEAAFPQVQQELLGLRDLERSGFQPYRAPSWASKRKAKDGVGSISHDGGSWNVLYLELHNVDFSSNRKRCPVTSKLLSNVPRTYGHAFFSAMAPGTHITAHHGPTNKKLRVHLPLIVPKLKQRRSPAMHADLLTTPTKEDAVQNDRQDGTCRLCVGDDYEIAKEGKCYIFDDSLKHEAYNDHADGSRIVLIFDIWHPDLSDQEIKFLHFLQASQMRRDRALCERRREEKEKEKEKEKVENVTNVEEDAGACGGSGSDNGGGDGNKHVTDVSGIGAKDSDRQDKTSTRTEEEGAAILEQENDDFYSIIERAGEIEPNPNELWSVTKEEQPETPPHVRAAALKEFEELKEAATLRAALLYEMENEEQHMSNKKDKKEKTERETMYDAIAQKKLEATEAYAALEQHKANAPRELSAVRQLLKCAECASKQGGMCDSCRQVFLSKEWITLHPEWESRGQKDKEKTASLANTSSTRKKAWPSAKSVLTLAKPDERKLVEQLGAARDREQTLLEELDAYKRALRFARNFIELEHHGDTTKMKKINNENKKLREAVRMYQGQLNHVSSENQRLAGALQEIVTGRQGGPTLESLGGHSPDQFQRRNQSPLVSPPPPSSRGFFTWSME